MKRETNRNNVKGGRPKRKAKVVCLGVRVEESFAALVQSAKERKGLEQGPYLQALITIGDKLLPNRPEIKIYSRPVIKP
jgi:hypothetical protein